VEQSIPVTMLDGERVLIPVGSRLLGRVAATDVVHPRDPGVVLVSQNTPLSDAAIQFKPVIKKYWCDRRSCVKQRALSASTAMVGVLAHAQMVDLGEAVGIIAAQVLGSLELS